MEQITSRQNTAVKDYIKLRDSKAARDKQGLFVAESPKLLAEALENAVVFEKVFVTPPAYEKYQEALQKLFERTEEQTKQAKLYEISADLEEKMTQTGNAQGLFAVCKKLDKQGNLGTIKKECKYLYLCRLQDTGNVGTILRTADALGMDGVIVSEDTCDRYSLKVLRASMGAVFRLPVYESADPCADLKALGEHFVTYAAVLDETALQVPGISFPAGSIVVIGNEGNGLAQEVIDMCRQTLTIKMRGNAESLNAGMAAGILMWEMTRGE